MRDLSPEVKAALFSGCPTAAPRIYYFYPEDFKSSPMLSYYDNGNSGDDDSDLLTSIAFQVDAWAETIPQLKQLISDADKAMRGLGLRRTLNHPLADPSGLRRQTMRFEGTYNAIDGKIYSRS
jgi:hypothetical protein